MFWFELFFFFLGFRRNCLPFLAAHATRICQVGHRQLSRRERKTQTRQKGKKLSEGPETRPGWKQCSGNSEVAQMQTQRRCSDYVIFKSYIILPNKVVKEVEKAGEEKNFSWLKTVRSIADRRLVSVLGITIMVMIKCRDIWSVCLPNSTENAKVHLCGISLVTAFLVDIFSSSAVSPLHLLLVSSFSGGSFSS